MTGQRLFLQSGYPLQLPLVFTDTYGQVETSCLSNGQMFMFTLRGITFTGHSFNFLTPDNPKKAQSIFTLDTSLTPVECLYEVQIPLLILTPNGTESACFHAAFDYRFAGNMLSATLKINTLTLQSPRQVDTAEYLIMDLQQQLPNGHLIACCLSCRNSHYSPFGANDIGDIFCFKHYADKLDAVIDKPGLLALWEIAHEEQQLYQMQETYCCKDFKQLKSNEWVYKDWNYILHSTQ